MTWKPHVTVAAVVARDGRFLMVEEVVAGRVVVNQPAGHLEPGERLMDAAVRETREETGLDLTPEGLVGIYRWVVPESGRTYLRIAFRGSVPRAAEPAPVDPDIRRALWLDRDALLADREHLRSPLVLTVIEDFLAGCDYPLELLRDLG